MKNIVNNYVRKFQTEHRERRKILGLLLVLALVVAGGVVWRLHSIGIAVTDPDNVSLATMTDANVLLAQTATGTDADVATGTDADGTGNILLTASGDTADEVAMETDAAEENLQTGELTVSLGTMLTDSSEINIIAYADADEKRSVGIIIADSNGVALSPDADGTYHLTADTGYFFSLAFGSTGGMEAGTYYYQFPEGVILSNTTGTLALKDQNGEEVKVGTWTFDSSTRRLIFEITSEVTSFVNVTLNVKASFSIAETSTELEFDGDIKVTVYEKTGSGDVVNKSVRESGTDLELGIITWQIDINGNEIAEDSIAGLVITDTILSQDTFYFSNDDFEAGITIYAGPSGNVTLHRWKVDASDPNLTWTSTGWTYTMPETVICNRCGEKITLGTDGWYYRIVYTSTVSKKSVDGEFVEYNNQVVFDGDKSEESITAGELRGSIAKYGTYESGDVEGSTQGDHITWTIQVEIPGTTGSYSRGWRIEDSMQLIENGTTSSYENEMELGNLTITASYGSVVDVTVPYIDNATASDMIAWGFGDATTKDGVAVDGSSGSVTYEKNILLYTRCTCTEDNCTDWENGRCNTETANGFCRCWCYTGDVVLTITYTSDVSALEETGRALTTQNSAVLYALELNNGKYEEKEKGRDDDTIDIPGVLIKTNTEKPSDENGKQAVFTITFNEVMEDLGTGAYSEITIVDTMSATLLFHPDSLVITATDENNVEHAVTAYTVDYTYDEDDNKATITIDESELGPYMYTLVYSADIYIPAGQSEFQYSNSAEVDVFGKTYSSDVDQVLVQDVTLTGEYYSIFLKKVDAEDGSTVLAGATFGVYNVNGNLMARVTTGDDGTVEIGTSVANGIHFYEHTLYYLQEIEAPTGYVTDDTKHWFWFCNTEGTDEACVSLKERVETLDPDGVIHMDTYAKDNHMTLTIGNHPYVTLPITGGKGILWYLLIGIILTTAATYLLYRRINPERERRCARPRQRRQKTRQRGDGCWQGRASP